MQRFRIDTPDQFSRVQSAIADRLAAGPLMVTVAPFKEPKTNPQLEKVHAMIREFSVSQSRSMHDMKDLLKFHLGYTRLISMRNGKTREVPKSFADATKEELSQFIEQLTVLAIEYNVELSQ
jgi:hypothetical protein